jgi:2-(3-amino-3-carboxypropyl)histidine synthase
MTSTLKDLEEKYNLELERILKEIKQNKAKSILLQFPDGLKPYATEIADYLKEKTNNRVQIKIWLGTCFGACDIPNTSTKDTDLIVQFGHSKWRE